MKKSAIQFALYLHAHPHTGREQWKMMRALPQGMSELLQVTASRKKRQELADTYGIEDSVMKEALHSFLRLVLSDHENSPYRGLAAREQASLETCQKHKKLLRSIFHPDRFPNDYCHEIMQQVQQSYEKIESEAKNSAPKAAEHTSADPQHIHRRESYRTSKPDFVINHSPRYSSHYSKPYEKKQLNYVLVAGIAGIALLGVVIMTAMPSGPQSIVRQDVISISNDTTPQAEEQVTLASSVSSKLPEQTNFASSEEQASKIQYLLNEFESALESNLIAELKASNVNLQSSEQIIDLFLSANDKKVFLHGFTWKPTSNGFYGEGEFLTRFEFEDRNQWITRRGKSSITLSNENSKLLIKQFHFEDNLH
ncbi:hypothetical protein EOL70_13340 [Leucothrix sargassi]|nr:hypothetical protein EOL70_13340 [Leucothrix sargassi]